MSDYYYSASTNAFYAAAMEDAYNAAGTWPDDAITVDDAVYQEFAANDAPEGKYRVAGEDGMPAWVDIPPPTHEEQVMQAAREKTKLLDKADEVIRRLERAVKYDMASDEDIASLEAWEKYSVLLMRVAPDQATGIERPSQPI